MLRLTEVRSPEDIALTRALFREYADSLGVDLAFQDFEREVRELPADYAAPRGLLLLAFEDGRDAGCGALRPLGGEICEMKRLYVRPDFRGHGVGRRLAEALIREARVLGYRAMRLDTLPGMQEAQEMYRALGFVEIGPYRENPVPGARFLELDLSV